MNPIEAACNYLWPTKKDSSHPWKNIRDEQPNVGDRVLLWDGESFSMRTYYGTDGIVYIWDEKGPHPEYLFWCMLPPPPRFSRSPS
jgi:hypothetical protein